MNSNNDNTKYLWNKIESIVICMIRWKHFKENKRLSFPLIFNYCTYSGAHSNVSAAKMQVKSLSNVLFEIFLSYSEIMGKFVISNFQAFILEICYLQFFFRYLFWKFWYFQFFSGIHFRAESCIIEYWDKVLYLH